jgi:Domain of unknown function (DUF4365)
VTANEQKQQMSVAYVHAIAARAGYACQVKAPDEESVDVLISGSGRVHKTSIVGSPRLEIQLKASASLRLKADHVSFPLPRKNYEDLRAKSLVPKVLVVLMLPEDPGEWLDVDEERMIVKRSAYWASLAGEPERSNTTSVSVRLPRSQRFTVDQLQELMKRVSREEPL